MTTLTKIKKIISTVVLIIITLTSCNWDYHSDSYILEYMEIKKLEVFPYMSRQNSIMLSGEKIRCVNFQSNGKDKIMYDSLCVANNDITYNNDVHLIDGDMIDLIQKSMTPGIVKLDVTSNKDFDENHPAGSSLNEFIDIEYYSAYDYINSGYQEDKLSTGPITRRLSSLPENDLKLPTGSNYGTLSFIQRPNDLSEHIITIKAETVNGKIFSDSIIFDFTEINKFLMKREYPRP